MCSVGRLFCSVLEFGPVPTPPTPLFQGAPVRLLAPKGVPPLNQWDGSQLLPEAGSRVQTGVGEKLSILKQYSKLAPCAR